MLTRRYIDRPEARHEVSTRPFSKGDFLTRICRTESVNFIHDVNVLRKTLKTVYGSSADLQALNSEIDKLPKNCTGSLLRHMKARSADTNQVESRSYLSVGVTS